MREAGRQLEVQQLVAAEEEGLVLGEREAQRLRARAVATEAAALRVQVIGLQPYGCRPCT